MLNVTLVDYPVPPQRETSKKVINIISVSPPFFCQSISVHMGIFSDLGFFQEVSFFFFFFSFKDILFNLRIQVSH